VTVKESPVWLKTKLEAIGLRPINNIMASLAVLAGAFIASGMKIAYLTAQYYPDFGGAEVCVHNIFRTLTERGDKAVVITTVDGPSEETFLGYEVVRLWNRTCGLLRKTPFIGKMHLHAKLAQLQKQYKFDIWQVTGGYPMGVYAADFFRKNGIPAVLRCCGEDIQKFPQIGYGYRLDPKIDTLTKL